MSNPLEVAEHQVALLPDRTVLSLFTLKAPADGAGDAGANGNPGQPGSSGDSIPGSGKTITYDHVEQTGDSTSR